MTFDLATRCLVQGFVNAEVCQKSCGNNRMSRSAGMNIVTKHLEVHDEWHAGDMGCGELVMILRRKLREMPGEVLKVIALDPAAPIDIAAWCRMTNNELLEADVPNHSYWIRSRMNWT